MRGIAYSKKPGGISYAFVSSPDMGSARARCDPHLPRCPSASISLFLAVCCLCVGGNSTNYRNFAGGRGEAEMARATDRQ